MVGPAALGEVVVRAEVGAEAEAEVDFETGTYLVVNGGRAAQVGTVVFAAGLLAERKIHLRLRPMDGRP